jgi:uncharacterized protein
MKFIVDNNVGRLTGWLRALGYDTLFVNPIDDNELLRIAQREGRIILTRDTGILARRVVTSGTIRAIDIRHDDWREQLAQVMREVGLEHHKPFTRCIECNTVLQSQTRADAEPHVPAYVFRTQDAFLVCPCCGRHYWRGTHWERMTETLERIRALASEPSATERKPAADAGGEKGASGGR